MTQLVSDGNVLGVVCRGCGRLKKLTEFPRASRREGRGTWCSKCCRKECSAKNFAFSRSMVARRKIQGGTEPLND